MLRQPALAADSSVIAADPGHTVATGRLVKICAS
jgi:hypothetical protein